MPYEHATHADGQCVDWAGPEKGYQDRAAGALSTVGREPSQFAWIRPKCGNPKCINPDHLSVHSPVTLAYPRNVCIYCGSPGWTKDHLHPRNWTGNAVRTFTVTVPACGQCNSFIGDALTWSITERRALCHMRIAKRYARVLRYVDYSEDEITEFGPNLRSAVRSGLQTKTEVRRRLAWPEDPAFDQRAIERSGIEDPYVLGLIISDEEATRVAAGLMRTR